LFSSLSQLVLTLVPTACGIYFLTGAILAAAPTIHSFIGGLMMILGKRLKNFGI
jgi:hypothetical protein